MRRYRIWIHDYESGCTQPMECEAKNKADARRIGLHYIRAWKLVSGAITDIQEVAKC